MLDWLSVALKDIADDREEIISHKVPVAWEVAECCDESVSRWEFVVIDRDGFVDLEDNFGMTGDCEDVRYLLEETVQVRGFHFSFDPSALPNELHPSEVSDEVA